MKKTFRSEKITAKENMTLYEKICFYDEIIQSKKLNKQEAIHIKNKLQELLEVTADRSAILTIRDLIRAVRPLT